MRAGRSHLAAAAASVALSVALAWPAVRTLSSRMWGDSGDAWQNWWNGWWMGEALSRGISPMFTDLLWHPHGASLWLHTLGPLNALLTAGGQQVLPGFAGYNVVVLAHLALGCFAAYLLCHALLQRVVAAGRLPVDPSPAVLACAAFAGGVTFGFSPYVWGHVSTHLHLTSIGFVALFAHALLTSLDEAGWRWPMLAGVWALAVALCGWYLLVDAAIVGAGVLAVALWRWRRDGWAPLVRVTAGGLLAALFCWPLLGPTLAAQSQPLEGTHDPLIFSADLLSWWIPAPATALGGFFVKTTSAFTGNGAENSGYLGYAALGLTALAVFRVRGAWLGALLGAGGLSLVLSLGPKLHWAGRVQDLTLPYAAAARMLPLDGLGCPVRFALVMNLAMAAGVAAGTAWLAAGLWRRGLRTTWVAGSILAIAAVVVAEYAPAGQRTSTYPSPAWLSGLADEDGEFAVADLTGWTHPLYNQTLHRRPIVHGYTSRRIRGHEQEVLADPVLGAAFGEALFGRAPLAVALERVEPRIGADWGAGSPAPGVHPDFAAEWHAWLAVPAEGEWTFVLGADDNATLLIDGRRVVENPGRHAYREERGTVTLTAGTHRLQVRFQDLGGEGRLEVRWRSPDGAEAVIPASALTTPDGEPGAQVVYRHRAATPRLVGEAAHTHLRERWGVRYVITYAWRATWAEAAGLERVAEEEGLRLYRVR